MAPKVVVVALLTMGLWLGHPMTGEGQGTVRPLATYHVDYGLGGRGLLRYNRAEGLFVGVAAERAVAQLTLTAAMGFARTDPFPQLSFGTTWKGPDHRVRAELFHRIQAFNPDANPLGIANSLSALMGGRDEGEYYRATGARLELSAPTREPGWSLTLYFERQENPESNAAFSLIGWPFPEYRGRALTAVLPLSQVGVAGRVEQSWGTDRAAPSVTGSVRGRAETGGVRLAELTILGSAVLPLGRVGRVSLRGGARGSRGDVPPQRRVLLGGPSTVRGFGGSAAMGPTAAWARIEVSVHAPIVTPVAFADGGWAGIRTDRGVSGLGAPGSADGDSKGLASVGVGFTLLDDVIRTHVARRVRGGSGWQFHLYLDPLR